MSGSPRKLVLQDVRRELKRIAERAERSRIAMFPQDEVRNLARLAGDLTDVIGRIAEVLETKER